VRREPVTRGVCAQELSDKRRAALQEACAGVAATNPPEAVRDAAQTLCAILANVLRAPRAREARRIPVDNPAFAASVGSLAGGAGVMAALGFEEEEEDGPAAPDGAAPRRVLVLNRVYLDDLRAALAFLGTVR
jgi:hypothetical protein